MNLLLTRLAAAALFATTCYTNAAGQTPVNAGPYVPSPSSVVADMLTLADVGPQDFVIDLGSGDGRIVLTAAKVFGARGFGVDINEKLVKEANEAAQLQGVADRARFAVQDLFKTDISRATVLTMYLLPNTVNMLKDKLLAELRPGTRIISHDYGLAGWRASKSLAMDLQDKVEISGVTTTLIFLYKVPEKFAGTWTMKVPPAISKAPASLALESWMVTRVRGVARIGAQNVSLEDGFMDGDILTFKLWAGKKLLDFKGTVKGNAIEGTVDGGGLKAAAWSASR